MRRPYKAESNRPGTPRPSLSYRRHRWLLPPPTRQRHSRYSSAPSLEAGKNSSDPSLEMRRRLRGVEPGGLLRRVDYAAERYCPWFALGTRSCSVGIGGYSVGTWGCSVGARGCSLWCMGLQPMLHGAATEQELTSPQHGRRRAPFTRVGFPMRAQVNEGHVTVVTSAQLEA